MLSTLSFYLLLSVTNLPYSVSASTYMYYVFTENHNNSTANNTLHHYTKNLCFSNTHLQLLSGKHYLNNTWFINDASNFSMHRDDTGLTTIYCDSRAIIVFNYSKNVNIKNLMIKNCGYLYTELKHWTTSPSPLLLHKCSDVAIQNCVFVCDYQQCGLAIIDPIGHLILTSIKSGQLLLIHRNTT